MNRLHPLSFGVLALVCFAMPALAADKIKTVVGGGPNGINAHAVNLPGLNTQSGEGGQITIDAQGNLYVLTNGNFQSGSVYKVSTNGTVSLIAGDGNWYPDVETGPAIHVELNAPTGIAVDNEIPANVFIADSLNCVVRKVDQKTGLISTVAGIYQIPPYQSADCGYSGDGGPANAAVLNDPTGLAFDPVHGDLYIADGNGVRKVAGASPTGTISTVTPTVAYNLALDTSVSPVNIFLGGGCSIAELIGATGKLYNVAGSTTACGNVNAAVASSGKLGFIVQLSALTQGSTVTLQAADMTNNSIRQFTVTTSGGIPHPGALTTVAGSTPGGSCSPTSPSAIGDCFTPSGVVEDAQGHIYIADEAYYSIHKAVPNGAIATLLGWEPYAYPPLGTSTYNNPPLYSNPLVLQNSTAQPALASPSAVFVDPATPLVYVGGGAGQAAYVWNSVTSRISDFAGSGIQGFAGDGSLADSSKTELSLPSGMTKDSAGNIYIADTGNCRIRAVSATTGLISTFAGGGSDPAKPCGYSGDGGPAMSAQFNEPTSVAFDSHGNLFVADQFNCAIRKIAASTHIVTTYAGSASQPACSASGGGGYSGDGGPAKDAEFRLPASVSFDGAGNLYIADSYNNVIREVLASSGIIQTVAGGGGGYDGPATQAFLNDPLWAKADLNGNVFIADSGDALVRWLTPSGELLTFAGIVPFGPSAEAAFYGDGGPALNAYLNYPSGIDQDANGNFYVADSGNDRIRQIGAFPGYGLSASTLTFAAQKAGTVSPTQTVTVSAIGPTKISKISVTHPFKETDNCAYTALATGQTCQIQITFDPLTSGASTGTLRIYSNAFLTENDNLGLGGNPDTVTLTGSSIN